MNERYRILDGFTFDKWDKPLYKIFTLRDIRFLLCFMSFSLTFMFLVAPALKVPYIIFSIIIGVCLILPSRSNPPKKIYHAVIYYVLKKRRSEWFRPVGEMFLIHEKRAEKNEE